MTATMHCPKCGQDKPVKSFRKKAGGCAVWCADCRRPFILAARARKEGRSRQTGETAVCRACGARYPLTCKFKERGYCPACQRMRRRERPVPEFPLDARDANINPWS